MSIFGPLDNLLRAYGDLQTRLRTTEADLAAAREESEYWHHQYDMSRGIAVEYQREIVVAREREQRLISAMFSSVDNVSICRGCGRPKGGWPDPQEWESEHAEDCEVASVIAAAAPSAVAQEPRGEGV